MEIPKIEFAYCNRVQIRMFEKLCGGDAIVVGVQLDIGQRVNIRSRLRVT